MADCMFLTLFSCWVMEMASCCWLVTAPLREEVKAVMSVCAFCLLAEPCRMISSRLAMVWLTSVWRLKRVVMFRSYSERALTAWLPFCACAVAMLRTAVFGTWLGSWPVTITEVGQEEMFLEAVEMRVQFWLYCVTRLLTAFTSALPETVEEEEEEEEEEVEVEGLEMVPMLMPPVLALRLKPSELPKLQFTPLTVSTCAPPEAAADESELDEDEEDEELVTVEMEESTVLTFWQLLAEGQATDAFPLRLTLSRMIWVSEAPIASVAVILTGNCPCSATVPLYWMRLPLSTIPWGSPWQLKETAPCACSEARVKKVLRSSMVGLLERMSLMESAEVNSRANNKIFISSINDYRESCGTLIS